jgi:hypothetical protein
MNTPALALRDIHIPEASWCPPAPGWWVLALLLTAASIFIAYRWYTRHHRRIINAALQTLHTIEQQYQNDKDTPHLAQNLSALLRRIAISRYPRHDIAALTGEAWLLWLDKDLPEPGFSQGPGRILVTAPYQSNPQTDANELLNLCRNWIGALSSRHANPKPTGASTAR